MGSGLENSRSISRCDYILTRHQNEMRRAANDPSGIFAHPSDGVHFLPSDFCYRLGSWQAVTVASQKCPLSMSHLLLSMNWSRKKNSDTKNHLFAFIRRQWFSSDFYKLLNQFGCEIPTARTVSALLKPITWGWGDKKKTVIAFISCSLVSGRAET